MNKEALDLLNQDRTGVISVILTSGDIHSAVVHFSHQDDPVKIYIQTSNDTLKAQPFLKGETGKGSMVVGFSEVDWLTLQMHGDIKLISDENELSEIYKIHYQKHPEAEKYKSSKTVFLEFIPTWWRYSDFNTDPETIVEGLS